MAAPGTDPRAALARSIGLAAFVYGYSLLESMRTCRLQTGPERAPIDAPWHWAGPTQADDRDIVTPANDLMYTTAWINLANGPRWLQVPAAASQPQRYFVLALYDAYTENFENLGPRNCAHAGERVLLVGPGDTTPLPAGARVLRAPTHLVWLIARVLVVDAADLAPAKQLQATIGIEPLAGSARGKLPLALERWAGDNADPIEALVRGGDVAALAKNFFTNLCHALADAPGREADRGHVAWFGQAGLKAGPGFDWDTLPAEQRCALQQGFADGAMLVEAASRNRLKRAWVLSWRNGRYGDDYFVRAIVAYIGLGALAPHEALYAAGHFDADGDLLEGRRGYRLRFEPGDLPPAEAFWSVTLYDADRFLYPNPLQRHAIGDRTPRLQRDPDGGLTLRIGQREVPGANWLPAPAGRFYLILRLYHPRDGVRGWRIPALQREDA